MIFYVRSHLLFSFCMGVNSLQQQQEEEGALERQGLQDRQGVQDRQQLERQEEYGGDRQELDLPRHFRWKAHEATWK
jgi:hypothetical protein